MDREDKLNIINSSKFRSITKFTNQLHELIADLYEALIDDDIHAVKSNKIEIMTQISEMKVDFK